MIIVSGDEIKYMSGCPILLSSGNDTDFMLG